MGQWVEGKQLTVKEVEAMGNKIKGKIDGLVEGCEYKFRIRAVNKGGPSKPGPPSDSMIAKHRFIPPHLLGDGIYDITLKKGRPIRSVPPFVWPVYVCLPFVNFYNVSQIRPLVRRRAGTHL